MAQRRHKVTRCIKPSEDLIIGDKYYNESDYTKALEYYEKFYKKQKEPVNCYAVYQMAVCHHLLADSQRITDHYKKALLYYDKILKNHCDQYYPLALFWEGQAYTRLGQYQEAISAYEQFMEIYTHEGHDANPEEQAQENIEKCKKSLEIENSKQKQGTGE